MKSSFHLPLLSTILIALVTVYITSCDTAPSTKSPAIVLPTADTDNGLIDLPDDFGAMVVADTLGRVRHIAVNDNGDIYVKLRRLKNEKGILALRDTDGDGRIDEEQAFGDYTGTGMRIHNGYLYATSDSAVFRYKLNAGELLPQMPREAVITDFPNQRQHASKTLTFDNAGHIYVNVGAPSNACQEEMRSPGSPGQEPCPQLDRQAGIWQFSDQPGQTQEGNGTRYATGIRNGMALSWNSQANSLYALQHGRDDLHRLWPDLFTQQDNTVLPSEEFLQIDEGDDFGWPFCYFDQNQDKKLQAPEYGGDGKTQGRCENIKKPILAFPGHLAPNDLLFYTGDQFPERYQNGAFIAFHGSWNRAPDPQDGYFVVFVPMQDGKPSGEWEVFARGFPQVEEVKSTRDAVYRPTGLAQGPDGSLYITDSMKGRIWRIMYYGKKVAAK